LKRKTLLVAVALVFLTRPPLAVPREQGGTPAATRAPVVTEADREEITRAIHDSIGWALTKDRARLESILAHDEDLFMFQPGGDQTIVGWDQFAKQFDVWMDPRFKATHFEVRDLRLNFARSGEVSWFSAILDDCGEWDGQPGCWKNTRWTGVFEKRNGRWIIVQMHFSFAAARGGESAEASGTP